MNVGRAQIGNTVSSNSSIVVGNYTKNNSIIIEEGGRLNGRIFSSYGATIDSIKVDGSIGTQGNGNGSSIITFRQSKIEKIEVGETGVIEGAIVNSWFNGQGVASGKSTINDIEIKGQVKGGIQNQSGTMQQILITDTGSVSGGIQNDDTMGNLKIENGGSVTGEIHNNNGATISGKVDIQGAITGRVTNNGNGNIQGDITISNGGSINATNASGQDAILNQGTIGGKVEVSANSKLTGNITNSGTITNGIFINGGSVGGDIKNSGTNAK
uniref:hypothetical protein n=1 Tax=uncultured Helicobacter sp. TaxID=175537 RepID=UPI002617DC58